MSVVSFSTFTAVLGRSIDMGTFAAGLGLPTMAAATPKAKEAMWNIAYDLHHGWSGFVNQPEGWEGVQVDFRAPWAQSATAINAVMEANYRAALDAGLHGLAACPGIRPPAPEARTYVADNYRRQNYFVFPNGEVVVLICRPSPGKSGWSEAGWDTTQRETVPVAVYVQKPNGREEALYEGIIWAKNGDKWDPRRTVRNNPAAEVSHDGHVANFAGLKQAAEQHRFRKERAAELIRMAEMEERRFPSLARDLRREAEALMR
jgi:hypothetical protein